MGRFADPWLLILTSVADGPKHGYAIMADVAAFSGVRMEPGTLYGALSRLERRGWVRPLPTAERRRPYEITAVGQEILAEVTATPGTPGRCPDLPRPDACLPPPRKCAEQDDLHGTTSAPDPALGRFRFGRDASALESQLRSVTIAGRGRRARSAQLSSGAWGRTCLGRLTPHRTGLYVASGMPASRGISGPCSRRRCRAQAR